MVQLEKNTLRIEIEVADGEAMETYLALLRSLFVLNWFVAEHGTDHPATLEATGFLSYVLGQALTKQIQ
ncbi:hypothetical protein ACAW74_26055 [Fibrella sp. WM1]|uniref:hypothetical protein n=1 Tax=Fibrella musci TaxID=3242485 RepID=UPI0035216CBF